jgi:guanylate kinase
MRNTFITLTGPSASGKTYLLNELVRRELVTRVVSITTRKPRAGEEHGVEYYFVTPQQYKELEAAGELVESISFNDTYYGTSKAEFKRALAHGLPLGMVLEPNGVIHFQHAQDDLGFNVFPVFVEANQKLRDSRLAARLIEDISVLQTNSVATEEIHKTVLKFISRVKATLTEEQEWKNRLDWKLIVPGDDAELAIKNIINFLR